LLHFISYQNLPFQKKNLLAEFINQFYRVLPNIIGEVRLYSTFILEEIWMKLAFNYPPFDLKTMITHAFAVIDISAAELVFVFKALL
jgi:hypothetical protein